MAEPEFSRWRVWIMRDTVWSRLGVPLAVVLLLLTPRLRRAWGKSTVLAYLQLPIYMFHQYEEHGHGAFKAQINRSLPTGTHGLTDSTIFWINILGVWVLDPAALCWPRETIPSLRLVPPYLALVNGLLHTAMGLKTRKYNPGLWTGVLLLVPFGAHAALTISRTDRATSRDHLRALTIVIVLHALVFAAILSSAGRRQRD